MNYLLDKAIQLLSFAYELNCMSNYHPGLKGINTIETIPGETMVFFWIVSIIIIILALKFIRDRDRKGQNPFLMRSMHDRQPTSEEDSALLEDRKTSSIEDKK